MFIMFILFWQVVAEKYWILKNVCLEIWAPARARGRSTIFCQGLFVRKKDTQTTDGRIVAVSFILGPPGLQTHVFSQPSSRNCNLFVLMLFPLGPAFIMSHSLTFEFQLFVISHANIWSSQPLFFPVGRFSSLGWGFGTFLVFDCRCLQRGAEDEKIQWNSCASCRSSTNMKNCFQHSKSNLGWILRCPHPGSWVLGPKSWSPAGNTEVHGALLVFHGNPGKTFFPKYVLLFWFPSSILVHVVPFFSFFPVCLLWDSGFYVFLPLGFSLFPYFSFGIHDSCFHVLSLYFPWSLDHAQLRPWAQGPAEVFTLRRWLTTRKFDMKQMKIVLKMVLKMITKDEKTTSQSKWNKTIKMTLPSLWLIHSQTLANK